jgi:hypothetical protein
MVVWNQEGVFEMKGVSKQYYRLYKILLDSRVQPFMLGKVTMEGPLLGRYYQP